MTFPTSYAHVQLTNGIITPTPGIPEIVFKLHSTPITTDSGHLVMPINEGISFPVNDMNVTPPPGTYLYGGHELCMA